MCCWLWGMIIQSLPSAFVSVSAGIPQLSRLKRLRTSLMRLYPPMFSVYREPIDSGHSIKCLERFREVTVCFRAGTRPVPGTYISVSGAIFRGFGSDSAACRLAPMFRMYCDGHPQDRPGQGQMIMHHRDSMKASGSKARASKGAKAPASASTVACSRLALNA